VLDEVFELLKARWDLKCLPFPKKERLENKILGSKEREESSNESEGEL
jgi:hypothetical protein